MLQRQVTHTQAIIALTIVAFAALVLGAKLDAPAVPLPSFGATTVVAAIVAPAMVLTLAALFSMMRDPAARAASLKKAAADAKNYY